VARLPDGLIRVRPPAAPGDLSGAEAALGRRLPEEYASFLRSFDGADLFHEAIVIAGVGPAPLALAALNGSPAGPETVFAETLAGDRFALDGAGRVLRLRAGSDERGLAGSSFTRWLDATVAREQLLYGPDGEFAPDVFDEGGEEVLPVIALRQAERASRVDPGSAEAAYERGLALRRLGRPGPARQAFAAATALDPDNPWPWFDLGRAALDEGRDPGAAAAAFRRAAALEPGAGGARLWVWAARAAIAARDEAGAAEARREALGREPALGPALARAEEQAAADGDEAARAEARALREALEPGAARPRLRLPLVDPSAPAAPAASGVSEGRPAPRPPPRRPRRPPPAARRRPGASPPARKPPRR
jgi:hypothetical protein